MKIRNHRKREWVFYPCDKSNLKIKKFKYKYDLIKFLNNNLRESVNGTVRLTEDCFGGSYTLREWFVWYNDQAYYRGAKLQIDLRQLTFRGRKYIYKPHKVGKTSKNYFAFSNKVISLMSNIKDDNGVILPKNAKRLVELFYKRGFEDFEPNEEDLEYINGHISDGIQFWHWSDRCNSLRMKTIIEYFKRENLI